MTDKIYWHGYMNEYWRLVFDHLPPMFNLLEFGVLHGDSIKYYLEEFPEADIYGVDIFDEFTKVVDRRFHYVRQDQGSRIGVREMLKGFNLKFDLMIDDGSHDPIHQANCLIEGFKFVKPNGFYIVEDIHTSFRRVGAPTIFHVLLMIKHLKDTSIKLTKEIQAGLNVHFTEKEISDLYFSVSNLHMIRRAHLPLRCWRCGTSNFDYAHLRCKCGEDLYKENDSMSFVLQKKG